MLLRTVGRWDGGLTLCAFATNASCELDVLGHAANHTNTMRQCIVVDGNGI